MMLLRYLGYLGIIFWSIFCISSSLVLMVLLFNRKIPLVMARTMWAPGAIFCAGKRLSVSGLENVIKDKPLFIVANHCSFLDIPCLFKAMPVNLHFVAKKSLRKIPFLGWYMIATGMIFIDRENPREAVKSVAEAAKLIANGRNVIMFPEGTRSKTGQLGPFKKGAFQLAMKSGVQILPIRITGTGGSSNKSKSKLSFSQVHLAIGEPIETRDFGRRETDNLLEITRNKIERLATSQV